MLERLSRSVEIDEIVVVTGAYEVETSGLTGSAPFRLAGGASLIAPKS